MQTPYISHGTGTPRTRAQIPDHEIIDFIACILAYANNQDAPRRCAKKAKPEPKPKPEPRAKAARQGPARQKTISAVKRTEYNANRRAARPSRAKPPEQRKQRVHSPAFVAGLYALHVSDPRSNTVSGLANAHNINQPYLCKLFRKHEKANGLPRFRPPSGTNRRYDREAIKEMHDYYIEHPDMTQDELAARYGLHVHTVWHYLRDYRANLGLPSLAERGHQKKRRKQPSTISPETLARWDSMHKNGMTYREIAHAEGRSRDVVRKTVGCYRRVLQVGQESIVNGTPSP